MLTSMRAMEDHVIKHLGNGAAELRETWQGAACGGGSGRVEMGREPSLSSVPGLWAAPPNAPPCWGVGTAPEWPLCLGVGTATAACPRGHSPSLCCLKASLKGSGKGGLDPVTQGN